MRFLQTLSACLPVPSAMSPAEEGRVIDRMRGACRPMVIPAGCRGAKRFPSPQDEWIDLVSSLCNPRMEPEGRSIASRNGSGSAAIPAERVRALVGS